MYNSKDYVESELTPIEEWLSFVQSGTSLNRSQQTELSRKVRKYLSSLGWRCSYIQKGTKRLSLRYKSPDGKWFYSLATACEDEDFIQQQQRRLIHSLSKLSLGPELNKKKKRGKDCVNVTNLLSDLNKQRRKYKRVKRKYKTIAELYISTPMIVEKQSLRFWRKDCGSDKNYNECCVCHCNGKLILCDGCPSAFHKTCLGLLTLPKEELWFCPHCCCDICGLMDSLENSMLMTCEQCQRRYHLNCLQEEPCSTVSGWFCSNQCNRVFSALQNLIGCKISLGEDDTFWTLIKVTNEADEQISKLDSAVKILHKGFMPLKDQLSGNDLVEEMIFKKGFYTVLIERNNKPVTAATMRVEKDVVEIPLVSTLSKYRRNGMCRKLMNEVEKQMSKMGVYRLVLPAAEETVTTWIQGFGFSVMKSSERLELVKQGMVDFVGTVMCHKFLKEEKKSQTSRYRIRKSHKIFKTKKRKKSY